jgi:RNA polymerase sigma-70 factor (ECF subfamily)
MTPLEPDTEGLLEQAAGGDPSASQELLARHRQRLRQMVGVRLDRRLAARLDPSDVVQEVLLEAHQKLGEYLRERPLPFYPWLRQLAWDHLVALHRRHVRAGKRSVSREEASGLPLPDESALDLACRLLARQSSPSRQAVRAELCGRVQAALTELGERDREVLVLRHLEQLAIREIAAVLNLSEGAVKVRHLRAMERLRTLLGADPAEGMS